MELTVTHKILAAMATMALASGCTGGDSGSVSCGLAAMNGPLVAMQGFAQGKTIVAPPASPPTTLPLRFVAGPAGKVTMSVNDSGELAASTELSAPKGGAPGYGVLIEDEDDQPMGILIYDGAPIARAPHLGKLNVAGGALPLLGVRVTRTEVETAECPLFPEPKKGS